VELAANDSHWLIFLNANQRRMYHGALKVQSAGIRNQFLAFVFESFQPTARFV
jgi:hypothetical protein